VCINPFQSNFSANRTLPSSYFFWAIKRLVDYPKVLKEKNMEKQKEYNLRYLLAKVRTT
jgi:alpha-N-acetylglucosamine transferase